MDKLLHLIVSYVLALIDPWVSFAAGVGKEVYDYFFGGHPDIFDLLADWAGILLSLVFT
jgi:hypothetical protein